MKDLLQAVQITHGLPSSIFERKNNFKHVHGTNSRKTQNLVLRSLREMSEGMDNFLRRSTVAVKKVNPILSREQIVT